MASSLQNVYYERKVGTARACYVCQRPTETVLATIKADDFVYTCDRHLVDPATPIAPAGPSADDVRKVVADYHEREARKADAADKSNSEGKDKDKDKDDKQGGGGAEGEGDKAGKAGKADATASPAPAGPAPASPASPASPAAHRKFALHRQIFESRKAEMRRKEQTARAREMSKGLPQVPRGNF